uniref:Lysine-specific metallo-endopeptidase domain-containing protein n=1 Tax=Biomphalaria glabrata TaxID=6526 RepID=A0A2C9M627_BIOGL
MLLFIFLNIVVTAALAANSSFVHDYHLSSEDIRFLQSLPRVKAGTRLPGFKYLYLEAGSHLTAVLNPAHSQLEIAGSPHTSQHALNIAADTVMKMTKYMPASMFQTLTRGSVGVFTAAEKLIIYPEMASLANGNCGTSCTGACSHTCTFDGRKYENIGGLTNSRSVILDDNVLCSPQDPHRHTSNILVHEFGHLVHAYAATPAIKTQITSAYNAAKQHQTWQLNTYAMANEHEYWAMATATFFGVTHESDSNTGGMNHCGTNFCAGVQQARDHLRQKDPALFNILSHVYTNNQPTLNPGIPICPSGSVVVG